MILTPSGAAAATGTAWPQPVAEIMVYCDKTMILTPPGAAVATGHGLGIPMGDITWDIPWEKKPLDHFKNSSLSLDVLTSSGDSSQK